MKFRRALAGVTLSLLASPAMAAGTTSYSITSTTFTDLGAAPVQVQTLGNSVVIIVADSTPAALTAGNNLLPGPPVIFQPADSSSHVYAAFLGSNATIVATPVYSTGGSGPITVTAAPYSYTALGGGQYNQPATSATALTPAATAIYARVSVLTGQMNFTAAVGSTPTTGTAPTVGTPMPAGSYIWLSGTSLISNFQLINAVASTGTWTAEYYK